MVIEIVDLPINSMVILNSYVNVYQRVFGLMGVNNPWRPLVVQGWLFDELLTI